MQIYEVKENRERYMDLLLLADESESMIKCYLYRGTMYVLEECGLKSVCIVADEGNGILEIKNLATVSEYQNNGYGRKLIDFVTDKYRGRFSVLQVGTGDSPLTVPFYEKCGFHKTHRIKNFFIDNYEHPIIECGKQLVDMVFLQKRI